MDGTRVSSNALGKVSAGTLLFLLLALPLSAQLDTGGISGVVKDSTGSVVPGAKVTATSERTGVARDTTTGNDGYFQLTELRVGSYTVSVQAAGFKLYSQKGVVVAVTEIHRLDATLEVGNVAESVEVTAQQVAEVETRESALGGVVEERRVAEMPLNGRNFLQLSYLQPGVTVNYRPITLKGSPSNVPGSVQLMPWVNGSRNTMNAVLIDGALNNDPVLNTAAIVPVPDAIEEFKIQTNMYTAEFGQGGGSVISIVTKSGGKAFHGDVYYFGRNEALDARNFFLPEKPKLRRHQFGAAGGGPLKLPFLENKNFFFATYEGLRLKRGQLLNAIVPSMAERAGDFSASPTPLTDPIGGCVTNNIINPSCMDPISVSLISRLWPEPNSGLTGYQAAPVQTNERDQFLVKLDHLTTSHNISGRYVIDDGIEVSPVAAVTVGVGFGGELPGFPVTNPSRFQNLALADTFVISPHAVNVARFTYLRAVFGNNFLVERDDPAALGFTYPIPGFPSLPPVNVLGFSSAGPSAQKDFSKRNNIFLFADTFSYEAGTHSVRFGGEVRRSRVDINTGNFTAGWFTFLPIFTGNPFGDYLLGAPLAFLQGGGDAERNFRSTSAALFFQDTYRIRPNFTLNLGLRWEYFGPFGDANAKRLGHPRLATFIPGRRSTYNPELPEGFVFAGFDAGVPDGIIEADLNNFAPRVGLAWDPFRNGKTSVRAGYGVFFDASVLDGVINSTDGTPSIRHVGFPVLPGIGVMNDPYLGNSPFTPPVTFPIPNLGADVNAVLVAPDQRTAYTQQWNLTIQQQTWQNMLFEIGYVGTKGTKLPGPRNLAQACLASVANPCNGETTNTLANLPNRRPFPGVVGLFAVSGEFNSNYHALQTSLTRRMANGLGFQTSYTWSKAIDESSKVNVFYEIDGQTNLQDNYNRRGDRALAAYDARHRFVANFMYELPFARRNTGPVNHLLGNWQVNGILTLQGASPFTAFDPRGRSLTDSGSGFAKGERPDLVCNPNLPSEQQTVDRWFNTDCFQEVPLGERFGNAGRNIIFGDSVSTFDFSVFKGFKPSETTHIQLRFEFFNLFNHPVFGTPINDFANPAFGRVLATSVDERQIQYGLKFIF